MSCVPLEKGYAPKQIVLSIFFIENPDFSFPHISPENHHLTLQRSFQRGIHFSYHNPLVTPSCL